MTGVGWRCTDATPDRLPGWMRPDSGPPAGSFDEGLAPLARFVFAGAGSAAAAAEVDVDGGLASLVALTRFLLTLDAFDDVTDT